jgi:hypothetical protein
LLIPFATYYGLSVASIELSYWCEFVYELP